MKKVFLFIIPLFLILGVWFISRNGEKDRIIHDIENRGLKVVQTDEALAAFLNDETIYYYFYKDSRQAIEVTSKDAYEEAMIAIRERTSDIRVVKMAGSVFIVWKKPAFVPKVSKSSKETHNEMDSSGNYRFSQLPLLPSLRAAG